MTNDTAFWDKIAEKYAKHPIGDMDAYEQTLDRVAHYLSPEDSMVEIGCGTATTALRLAPMVRRVIATDISSEMVRIGRDKAMAQGIANVENRQATSADPYLTTGQHDVVTAFSLLHLLDDLERTLADIHAMLRPGGLFISKTPCLSGMWYLRPVLPIMACIGKAPGTVRWLSPEGLEAAIRWAGFEIVETGDYPAKTPPRHFIVARKI